ncbi:UNVERIFIED_CONTAM: hypothetical protein Sradi_3556100 [Sesamum radiatum]|uniref:Reverse transcriptase zinc-binding domain-containing protein n=1 Tax=Sesamum radiatum TaxID=300843 RepID=A0AAW2QFX1_SESRA
MSQVVASQFAAPKMLSQKWSPHAVRHLYRHPVGILFGLPSKIRIFAWKMCVNEIPTSANLQRSLHGQLIVWPLCEEDPNEDVEHALLLPVSYVRFGACPTSVDCLA